MESYRDIANYSRSSVALAPEIRSDEYRQPDVKVRPGGQKGVKGYGFKINVRRVVVTVYVIVCLFFIATAVRLSLYSQSVNLSLETNNISNEIKNAYGETSSLGIERSSAENSTKIKEEAGKLGMSRQLNADSINLKPDVITLDSEGRLSVAQSIMKAGQNNSQA